MRNTRGGFGPPLRTHAPSSTTSPARHYFLPVLMLSMTTGWHNININSNGCEGCDRDRLFFPTPTRLSSRLTPPTCSSSTSLHPCGQRFHCFYLTSSMNFIPLLSSSLTLCSPNYDLTACLFVIASSARTVVLLLSLWFDLHFMIRASLAPAVL